MKNPIEQIKDYRKKRAEQPKHYMLPYGEQDVMDIISYDAMEEQPDYIRIGKQYMRTLFISGYPAEAETGWMDSLTNFHHNAIITQHIEQVPTNEALKILQRKITELQSARLGKMRSGSEVSPDIEDPLRDAKALRGEIRRGQEKLFQVSIYAALTAPTLEILDETTQMLASSLSARLFYTKVAAHQQLEGLQSILPRGEDVLAQKT